MSVQRIVRISGSIAAVAAAAVVPAIVMAGPAAAGDNWERSGTGATNGDNWERSTQGHNWERSAQGHNWERSVR